MIKALAGDTIALVITDENIERMKKGQPILVDFGEMGGPPFSKLQIHWSRNLQETLKEMAPLITSKTRIHGKEN